MSDRTGQYSSDEAKEGEKYFTAHTFIIRSSLVCPTYEESVLQSSTSIIYSWTCQSCYRYYCISMQRSQHICPLARTYGYGQHYSCSRTSSTWQSISPDPLGLMPFCKMCARIFGVDLGSPSLWQDVQGVARRWRLGVSPVVCLHVVWWLAEPLLTTPHALTRLFLLNWTDEFA